MILVKDSTFFPDDWRFYSVTERIQVAPKRAGQTNKRLCVAHRSKLNTNCAIKRSTGNSAINYHRIAWPTNYHKELLEWPITTKNCLTDQLPQRIAWPTNYHKELLDRPFTLSYAFIHTHGILSLLPIPIPLTIPLTHAGSDICWVRYLLGQIFPHTLGQIFAGSDICWVRYSHTCWVR